MVDFIRRSQDLASLRKEFDTPPRVAGLSYMGAYRQPISPFVGGLRCVTPNLCRGREAFAGKKIRKLNACWLKRISGRVDYRESCKPEQKGPRVRVLSWSP